MQLNFWPAHHIHVSGQRGNAPRDPDAAANVKHLRGETIDKICEELKFDERDRQFMRTLYTRHEAGEATLPERILGHLVPRLLIGCVIVSLE